ncbi:MAG TPA: pentapeptide repeat-containing protein [Pyrinomonadaceae bacterium]|jgi:hypothetical protein
MVEIDYGKRCYIGDDYKEHSADYVHGRVCYGLPIFGEFEGKKYCVLHFPSFEKIEEFRKVFKERLEKRNFNFRAVWFPESVTIIEYQFENDVDFTDAKFIHGVYFSKVYFKNSVDFGSATFNSYSWFSNVTFNEGLFWWAKFQSEINFNDSVFIKHAAFQNIVIEKHSTLHFQNTTFKGFIGFGFATQKGRIYFEGEDKIDILDGKEIKKENLVFEGEDVVLRFGYTKFENPENISFHTTRLYPNWFVGVGDCRKLTFTDVRWENIESYTTKLNVKNELKNLDYLGQNKKQLFKITCRQLAENAENNNRFEEASNFRRLAMETEWLEKKEKISNWIKSLVPESEKLKRRFGSSTKEEDVANPPTNSFGILHRSGDFIIHGLYRITSYYGESWVWAAIVLLILVFVAFPLLYTRYEFLTCPQVVTITRKLEDCHQEKLSWYEATEQSLGVASLQRIEHRKPIDESVGWIIFAETISVPFQVALLALAIRRKFMR